jgi:hypothetical protein
LCTRTFIWNFSRKKCVIHIGITLKIWFLT